MDIDALIAHEGNDLCIVQRLHVHEVTHTCPQPLAHGRVAWCAPRQAEDLESRSVVQFENLGHQARHGVVAEIGGKVGHTHAARLRA